MLLHKCIISCLSGNVLIMYSWYVGETCVSCMEFFISEIIDQVFTVVLDIPVLLFPLRVLLIECFDYYSMMISEWYKSRMMWS